MSLCDDRNKKKDLAAIIKANPGCCAIVDNDRWYLYKVHPRTAPGFDTYEDEKAWYRANRLARDGEVIELGDGYGSGCCYGGDLLQSLAKIVGVTVESA